LALSKVPIRLALVAILPLIGLLGYLGFSYASWNPQVEPGKVNTKGDRDRGISLDSNDPSNLEEPIGSVRNLQSSEGSIAIVHLGAKVTGRVISENGQAIAGASVEWVRVQMRGHETYLALSSDVQPFTVITRLSAKSQVDGTFELDLPGCEPRGVVDFREVLWFGKRGYVVACQVRESQVADFWKVGDWVQAREPATTVVSRDGEQRPLANISISQQGFSRWGSLAADLNPIALFGALYSFSDVTDADGEASLPFFPTQSTIRGEKPGKGSRVWRGMDPRRIDFEFGVTAALSGSVSLGPNTASPTDGKVFIEFRDGMHARADYVLEISDQLTWGPIDIEIENGSAVLVRASATGLYGPRVKLPPLNSSENTEVTLQLNRANDLWAVACDTTYKPVLTAVVSAEWRDQFGLQAKRMRPQASGHVMFTGIPDGRVVLRSVAEGYCESSLAVHLPDSEPVAYALPMDPGTAIEGVCLEANEPCHAFDIIAWPSGFPEKAVRRSYHSQDGRFRLHGVARGALVVMASGIRGNVSQRELVPVGSKDAGSLKLVLGIVGEVAGKLVAEDDQTLSGAFVQYQVGGVNSGRRRWVDADGGFAMPVGQVDSGGVLKAGARGYSTKVFGIPLKPFPIELGEIILQKTFGLEITVLMNPGASPSRVTIGCSECGLPAIAPNSDGIANYPNVDVGDHAFEVQIGETFMTVLHLRVGAQDPARATIDLRGTGSLVVQLKRIPEEFKTGLSIYLSRTDDASGPGLSFGTNTEGAKEVHFEDLKGGQYLITVADPNNVILGANSFVLQEGEVAHQVVDLDRKRVLVKLLDRNGEAIPQVWATFYREDGSSLGDYVSNESGILKVIPFGSEPVLLCLSKEGVGHHWNIPISLPDGLNDQPIEVVMNCEASMTLRLIDRGGPLVNQECSLKTNKYVTSVGEPRATDSEGLVTFPKLSPGEYLLIVDAPDHWPFYKDFNATLDGEIQEVEIPRLAEITVEVRNAQGVIVSGQEVRVWTVDYDKDTKYWQEIGVMDVVPADWKTDVTGRVHIPKFPEGNYLCSTLAGNGERVEVPFEVRPGRANVALISLP
jgi:hypothetical protein